eukprot:3770230-Pleurochrysis_carterae.AAC.2
MDRPESKNRSNAQSASADEMQACNCARSCRAWKVSPIGVALRLGGALATSDFVRSSRYGDGSCGACRRGARPH